MICKDCKSFKSNSRLEVGKEISANLKDIKGTCDINSKECSSIDNCGCGEFTKK